MPVAEKALIAQIRRLATGRGPSKNRHRTARENPVVIAGIGDDCAVLCLPPGRESLVTTDFSLEGIHFRRDWHPPESVGHRCLARGMSDISAMGGDPVAAFLSLALPRDLPQAWVERFLRGLIALAEKFAVTLAGGDTAQSPNGVLSDIIVVGTVPKGKAVLRSGARPGDRIYVSGELGGSAAALQQMGLRQLAKPKRKLNSAEYPRHFFPEPRIKLGRMLREKGLASAMIDTSDGLSTDLAHLCTASNVSAELDLAALPLHPLAAALDDRAQITALLHGGEDYELLFTAPRNRTIPSRIAGVQINRIGHITRTRKILMRNRRGVARKLDPQGWEHFRH